VHERGIKNDEDEKEEENDVEEEVLGKRVKMVSTKERSSYFHWVREWSE
jgi:hypothetical protein